MQAFAGMSLRTRLYLLVLLAFVPVGFLFFATAEEQMDVAQGAVLKSATTLARAASNEEHQQFEATRNLLQAVSGMYLTTGGNNIRLNAQLSELIRRSEGYLDIGVVDLKGRLAAGVNPADGRDFRQQDWFMRALSGNGLAMGDYQGEHIDGKPVLTLALPVRDGGPRTLAVAYAALNLDWMNRTIFNLLEELPAGSRLTLIDAAGGMLSYEADTRTWFTPAGFDPSLRQEILSKHSGTAAARDPQGIARLYAFQPLSSPFRDRDMYVVLEIPRNLALAASRKSFIRNIGLLVLFAALATLSIWWAGDVFILKRVRAMVTASRRLAGGDLDARVGKTGSRDELGYLATVFDDMASALQVRQAREQQTLSALQHSREQLRSLSAYQQQTLEKERVRIAREIHDDLGQSLTILKMDLSWLKKSVAADTADPIHEKMKAMCREIDTALKTLHVVMAELRPVILDDFGLAAAIEWQAEEFQNRTGIPCRVSIGDPEPVVDKEQATALFRIFQETLTNVARHAQAKEVEVGLWQREGSLVLEVRDNGRGITAAEIDDSKSFGIIGMRERLYPWNGTIEFEGRPGQGTRVAIAVPMQVEEEN